MLKSILITSLMATTLLIADNTYLGTPIIKNTQHQKVKKSKLKRTRSFKKDDHRYNKRYRNFDYDRNGYYNDDGFYFGFFDRNGYFYNNIYFEYNSQYGYTDRFYRRGYFEPSHHHYRRYTYYRDNDWNRVHQYREPDVIIYNNYYESQPEPYYYEPYYQPYYYRREGHVISHHYREDRRDSYRRDHAYRNSHYNNHRHNSHGRRDSYDREYHRDSERISNHRFSNSNSHRSPIRSSGHIHDRKSSNNKGRLQITK